MPDRQELHLASIYRSPNAWTMRLEPRLTVGRIMAYLVTSRQTDTAPKTSAILGNNATALRVETAEQTDPTDIILDAEYMASLLEYVGVSVDLSAQVIDVSEDVLRRAA